MRQSEVIRFYSRKDVSKELTRLAENREVAMKYRDSGFGKRPDTIQFPAEVVKLARRGVTSFHASEEHWKDPLQLSAEATIKQLTDLRSGFDLVLDIDCPQVEFSKIAAKLLCEALRYHNISNVHLKFSGGSGFHIGVPFKALPAKVHGKPTEKLFPQAPRVIAEYLSEFIKPHLGDYILETESNIKNICKKTGKKPEELFHIDEGGEKAFNPYAILGIDTVLISSRHLFRMPYSLNEKKWFASTTLTEKELEEFTTDWARPENVEEVRSTFLNPETTREDEARELVIEAFDWKIRQEQPERASEESGRVYEDFSDKVPEGCFPPCVHNIMKGLEDGRKRSIFILANFLRSLNWGPKEIAEFIEKWNTKNHEPIKTGYIRSQLKWTFRQSKRLPPNCDNKAYYKDFGICTPDNLCQRIKNPVNYAIRKSKMSQNQPQENK